MSIKVMISAYLQRFTNHAEVVEVNGSTVGECLKHLVEQFPLVKGRLFDRQGKLLIYFNIYVNEKSVYPQNLDKPVRDGDEIRIATTIGGG